METVYIKNRIADEIGSVNVNLRNWIEKHLSEPQKITLYTVNGVPIQGTFFTVTCNMENSYEVIFHEETDSFGLECRLENGVLWYMGDYGSFDEAVNSI